MDVEEEAFPVEAGDVAEIVAKFEQFFRVIYKRELSEYVLSHPNTSSIVVDFKKIEEFDYGLADALLDNPKIYIDAMETALSRVEVSGIESGKRLKIGLANIPSDRTVLVRDIKAEFIGKIVGSEGLVRQITTVMPKLKVAKWACRHCGKTYDILQESSKLKRPVVCVCGKRDFELLADESIWIDFQKVQIQEPIEHLRGGEQARFIDVHLEGDLVNRVKPGDRVNVVGILELLQQDGKKTVYGKYINALNLETTQKEFEELEPTADEIKQIKELANDPHIYDMLVKSIAPTIWGHEKIKEAIALQLFGGVKKEYSGGTNIRGNIHILLMGDPSTGKSQMLRYAAQIAPKSIYVAGKTASGAGLTASAEKDELGEGGWVIKAGALVLASGGVAAVDEFEKIDAKDRTALHEAMEQQSYAYDFEIMLADGSKRKIGELVDELIESAKERVILGKDTEILPDPGIEIIGYDLNGFKTVRLKADRVSRHVAPGEIVEIEFSNGRIIRVTPEHPVMIYKGGDIVEVPASEVRPDDLALAVNGYELKEEKIDIERARNLGRELPKGERIPEEIMRADKEAKEAFLRAYLEEKGESMERRETAEDVQDLLYSLGIPSVIEKADKGFFVRTERANKGNGRLRVCRVEKKEYKEKWVYDVTVEPYHLFISHGLVLHNTVSVAKAGIVTTFKADTAILAAANPKFGRFDPYENPVQQINIEPTLLSRFDLIFIVKEVLDAERDRQIARHILKTHLAGEKRIAYLKGMDSSLTAEDVEDAERHVKPAVDVDLLRKYIAFARTRIFPRLTEEAMDKIEDFYVNLRQRGKKSGTVPTTARQLEALIRLAESSARVRLSDVVTGEDAERAINLAKSSMDEILKDKETGVIDYDIITTGESKGKREKMKIILNVIRSYTSEHDSMPIEDLVEEAKTYGIEEEDVYEIVEKLKKGGEIYEPRQGVLRLAG